MRAAALMPARDAASARARRRGLPAGAFVNGLPAPVAPATRRRGRRARAPPRAQAARAARRAALALRASRGRWRRTVIVGGAEAPAAPTRG